MTFWHSAEYGILFGIYSQFRGIPRNSARLSQYTTKEFRRILRNFAFVCYRIPFLTIPSSSVSDQDQDSIGSVDPDRESRSGCRQLKKVPKKEKIY
jgi:hypothetical protein